MSLEGLRWSCNSGSALYDTPPNGRSRTGWGGQYNDPHNENKPTHRVPPAPIYVNQEGRCLAFDSSLVGETIKVVSDETLLYTTVIGEDGKIEIPEYIFGEIELRLVRGSLIYHVMITL